MEEAKVKVNLPIRPKKQYIILQSSTADGLSSLIEDKLNKGWVLSGTLIVTMSYLYQAMYFTEAGGYYEIPALDTTSIWDKVRFV